MTTIENAHREWATRRDDEKFSSVEALHAKAVSDRRQSVERRVEFKSLHTEVVDGDVKLIGPSGGAAKFTNHSFGALCRTVNAPHAFVSSLSPETASKVINERIETTEFEKTSTNILFRSNGEVTARAFVSDKYTRIWNADITQRLLDISEGGVWQPAPAAFDGSRGLYLGDRDMFAFMVDNNRRIFEKQEGGLSRGFFTWNSEVGARSWGVTTFLYEFVCGNHRVWGAKDIVELTLRHVGDLDKRGFGEWRAKIAEYANSSAEDDEAKIERSRNFEFGATKDEVIDTVFGLKTGLTRDVIGRGFDRAVEHEDWYGNPRSAWGLLGGVTEIARDIPNADERVAIERAAAKVNDFVF